MTDLNSSVDDLLKLDCKRLSGVTDTVGQRFATMYMVKICETDYETEAKGPIFI